MGEARLNSTYTYIHIWLPSSENSSPVQWSPSLETRYKTHSTCKSSNIVGVKIKTEHSINEGTKYCLKDSIPFVYLHRLNCKCSTNQHTWQS